MKKAGISVVKEPLKVSARVLKAPQIRYLNGNLFPEPNGKWRLPKHAKYEIGATLKRWLGIFLIVPNERMHFKEFVAFVKRFYEECGIRGLQIDEPYDLRQVVCDVENIEAAFRRARKENCQFILFGHSDRDTKFHSFIKAMERKYEVITQCVKTKTIYNVMEQSPVSLENIVAKANVKLGGLNHSVVLADFPFDKNVLFVGLGMNHPGVSNPHEETNPSARAQPQTAGTAFPSNVSVLGFCANDGAIPNEFIGNFFFSPVHRDEKLSVLDKLLEEVFERFHRNRQCAPTRIILFRSGCDEGAYRSVLKYEMPIITAICENYAPGAPVSVIIPSKLQQVRFFKQNIDSQDRSDVQNIRPGTVVDGNVTSSAFCEYYSNSHLALQGTAKTPKYTILYSSEKEVNLDLFERWTNALCYDFQIVTSPTSVPAPVYIAQRYAERGRQIWNTFSSSNDANLDGNISNINGQNGLGAARSWFKWQWFRWKWFQWL
uniref:Piwi domain-containing protein n=1 Tax=Panagrolaimus davidi TaxID=227884 RepID=A0A914PDF5_9BILA